MSQEIRTVAFDMDGVLVHLYEAILAFYRVDPVHVRDMAKGLSVSEVIREHALECRTSRARLVAVEATEEKVWTAICSQSSTWWKKLRPDPQGMLLLAKLAARETDIFVVSQPLVLGRNDDGYGESAHGKRQWLEYHLPAMLDGVVFTRAKHRLSAPGVLLIDDSPTHVREWRERGGPAVLWHQPWNAGAPEHTGDELSKIMHLEAEKELPDREEAKVDA